MEPVFEVRYFATGKMLSEFARKYSVGPRVPVMILFWILYGFVLSVFIRTGAVWEEGNMLLIFGLCMLLVSFMPQWYAWLSLRNTKKQNDGILPETVVTFGDTIEMHEGMVHLTIEYRKVIRTVRLKHSYMLMIGKRNGVMLAPDGFTKGSFEEFKHFIREKCPELSVVE